MKERGGGVNCGPLGPSPKSAYCSESKCLFKVAPFSLATTSTLGTTALEKCVRLKENVKALDLKSVIPF